MKPNGAGTLFGSSWCYGFDQSGHSRLVAQPAGWWLLSGKYMLAMVALPVKPKIGWQKGAGVYEAR